MQEAEDDLVLNAKDNFEETNMTNLAGLKFDSECCINGWTKRKEIYEPSLKMPNDFEKLLNGKFDKLCPVFISMYSDNINKEITSLLVSAHILLESWRQSLKS